MLWNRKRSPYKNHKNYSPRPSMKGRLFRTFNSYSFNFIGGLCNHRTGYYLCQAPCLGGEQILLFLKNYLLRFYLILLSFDSSKHLCFEMCLVRSTTANLCPIMIYFNESLWRSGFFWRSVYFNQGICLGLDVLKHGRINHSLMYLQSERKCPLHLEDYSAFSWMLDAENLYIDKFGVSSVFLFNFLKEIVSSVTLLSNLWNTGRDLQSKAPNL